MYRLRVRAGALAAVALVAAAGLVLVMPRPAAADVASATVQIVQGGGNSCSAGRTPSPTTYCFAPPTVSIAAGATVTWTDATKAILTLKRCGTECPSRGGNGGDSPFGDPSATLGPQNESYAFTFKSPGTYFYDCGPPAHCAIGEVTITPTASPTPVQLSAGAGTAPSHTPAPTSTPAPTPTPTPSPSDTSSAVAIATPDTSPAAPGSFPLAAGGSSGGDSPLVVMVLIILIVVAVGGGVLSFRLYRR
jgi:plastocyanin